MANAKTVQADYHDGPLLELARSGDELAIEQLARTHWHEAYRAALRIVRSHEDAEEIAQDSLWAAIRHLPTFRKDASFRTWLYRIVVNRSLMALRRKRCRGLDSTMPLTVDSLPGGLKGPRTPEELVLERERLTVVEEALSQLPCCYATVLQLVAREDPSMSDIANRVGISTNAVKARLHRGRQQLRRNVGLGKGLRRCQPEAVETIAA
jgi:RNA polymerase sigma-70 factor (ECF subfamily)